MTTTFNGKKKEGAGTLLKWGIKKKGAHNTRFERVGVGKKGRT